MSRKIITTIATAGLLTLGGLSIAGPAHAENPDPSGPSITLDWQLGNPEVQSPAQGPAPEYYQPEIAAPAQGGGVMQYETENGTPLNLQNADGTPLDVSAIQPGESVTVYETGAEAPQEMPAQQIPGSQSQTEVFAPAITAEEMAQVEKSQQEFGNIVLAVLIGFAIVFGIGIALIVRSVRRRSRKKREALTV